MMSRSTRVPAAVARLLLCVFSCLCLSGCGWLRNEFFIYDRQTPVEMDPAPETDTAEVGAAEQD